MKSSLIFECQDDMLVYMLSTLEYREEPLTTTDARSMLEHAADRLCREFCKAGTWKSVPMLAAQEILLALADQITAEAKIKAWVDVLGEK